LAELLDISFKSTGVQVEGLKAIYPELKGKKSGELDANGRISLPGAAPKKLKGSVDLSLSNFRLFDLPIDALSLTVSANLGIVHIADLEVTSGGDLLTLKEVRLPLDSIMDMDWSTLAKEAEGRASISAANFDLYRNALPDIVAEFFDKLSVSRFKGDGRYSKGSLVMEEVEVHSQDFLLQGVRVDVDFTPLLLGKSWEETPVKGEILAQISDLSVFRKVLPEKMPLHGRLDLTGRLDGLLGTPLFNFTLNGADLLLQSYTFDKMVASGQYEDSKILLDNLMK